jgi:hypothetical protein
MEHPLFFLLCRFTAPAPPWTCRAYHHWAAVDNPLWPPRLHPKHHAIEFSHTKRSDPASDPYSGLLTSFPRRQSPPPWIILPVSPPSPPPPIRSTTLLACSPTTPPPTTGRRPARFCRQAIGADGGESFPCFLVVGQKAISAKLTWRARPSTCVDPSPLQQCHFVPFHLNYSNSILIKVQTS